MAADGATKMFKLVLQFAKNEVGATSIEYAIIAAGISIVIVAAVQAIGGSLQGMFTTVLNGLTAG
jgi:pilus assembly protein Flp/PilA